MWRLLASDKGVNSPVNSPEAEVLPPRGGHRATLFVALKRGPLSGPQWGPQKSGPQTWPCGPHRFGGGRGGFLEVEISAWTRGGHRATLFVALKRGPRGPLSGPQWGPQKSGPQTWPSEWPSVGATKKWPSNVALSGGHKKVARKRGPLSGPQWGPQKSGPQTWPSEWPSVGATKKWPPPWPRWPLPVWRSRIP